MKKSIIICELVLSAATFGSTARAVTVNPAEWNFIVMSYFELPAWWTSGTDVDTSYPQYDYTWEITEAGLKLNINGTGWEDILHLIPEGDRSGSGTEFEIPDFDGFEILDRRFEESGVFGVDIYAYVDENGTGHVDASNIYFGSYEGHDVTGLGLAGNITVTAIPEPATIALLGLGALVLIRRKRSA